jgi:hypothetical protein
MFATKQQDTHYDPYIATMPHFRSLEDLAWLFLLRKLSGAISTKEITGKEFLEILETVDIAKLDRYFLSKVRIKPRGDQWDFFWLYGEPDITTRELLNLITKNKKEE